MSGSALPRVVPTADRSGAPAGPLLRVYGVSKRWPRLERPVLDGVDLEVGVGEACLLSGRNGAGKTTLMRIVAGLIRPDAGSVALDGLSPERARQDFTRRIGVLSAGDRGLHARLSVQRHLELWARLAFLERRERPEAVARAVRRFSLEDIATARVDRLSQGQRQRTRLALAFMHEPRLLLLDEPANSLDDEARDLLSRTLERSLSEGAACLWISPSADVGGVHFDRRMQLVDGTLGEA